MSGECVWLELGWKVCIGDYFECLEMCVLVDFLCVEKWVGKEIYLLGLEIFVVFDYILFEMVWVVIFG